MPMGVQYSNLVQLIDFIYNGEIRVPSEDLPSFMALMELLKIRGLTDAIKNHKGKHQQNVHPQPQQQQQQHNPQHHSQEVSPNDQEANSENVNHNCELSSTSSTISMTSKNCLLNVDLVKGISEKQPMK